MTVTNRMRYCKGNNDYERQIAFGLRKTECHEPKACLLVSLSVSLLLSTSIPMLLGLPTILVKQMRKYYSGSSSTYQKERVVTSAATAAVVLLV